MKKKYKKKWYVDLFFRGPDGEECPVRVRWEHIKTLGPSSWREFDSE